MRFQQRRKRFFAALTMLYAVLLVVFCITRFRLLFWLLGNPLLPETGVNLIPFASLMQGIRQYGGLSWDMLGNLLMYVPAGVMFCYRHNARWWQNALLGAGVSVAVELLQLLLHTGSCDVDDFLVNAQGSFAGAAGLCVGSPALQTRKESSPGSGGDHRHPVCTLSGDLCGRFLFRRRKFPVWVSGAGGGVFLGLWPVAAEGFDSTAKTVVWAGCGGSRAVVFPFLFDRPGEQGSTHGFERAVTGERNRKELCAQHRALFGAVKMFSLDKAGQKRL